MFPLFCTFFGLFTGGLLVGLFVHSLYKKSIVRLTNDLRQLNREDSNTLLRAPMPGDELALMVLEVNRTITAAQDARQEYRKSEADLRHAIENVSHDLRTPLTSIMGYLQLIEDPRTSPEERRQYFAIVRTRAQALESLINQFYDLSRIQANEYNFTLGPVDLPALLAEQMAAYYQNFTELGMEPHLAIEENLPPVLGDGDAIIRIFTNLLQNILKHGYGQVHIRLYLDHGQVVSSFTNNALDLKSEDIPLLFDRFFTVDRMRTGQNTGLGLAIIKAMVDRMGHRVWAHGENGQLTIGIRWRTLPKEPSPYPTPTL